MTIYPSPPSPETRARVTLLRRPVLTFCYASGYSYSNDAYCNYCYYSCYSSCYSPFTPTIASIIVVLTCCDCCSYSYWFRLSLLQKQRQQEQAQLTWEVHLPYGLIGPYKGLRSIEYHIETIVGYGHGPDFTVHFHFAVPPPDSDPYTAPSPVKAPDYIDIRILCSGPKAHGCRRFQKPWSVSFGLLVTSFGCQNLKYGVLGPAGV